MGYDYITVQGNVASNRSANALASSGEVIYTTIRVEWDGNGGFTNAHGWMFGEPGNGIEAWWKLNWQRCGGENDSEAEFIKYASSVDNLNEAFDSWDDELKYGWFTHVEKFGYDYLTGEFTLTNCIRKL